jgi:uncharacterized protein
VTAPTRHPLPDALRALALVGVLVVNAAGYVGAPWGPLMGVPTPDDSVWAEALQGLQTALLQGKAYPLLAALFGMGLVWSLRSGSAADLAGARSRMRALLALGVLHGALIFFGDILTMYALSGWLALRWVRQPWSRLRRVIRRVWWAFAVVSLLTVAWAVASGQASGRVGAAGAEGVALGAVDAWTDFLTVNAQTYAGANVLGLVFSLPQVLALVLAGVAAARLRWLTHRRWRAQRAWLASRVLWPMLVLNVGYGWAMVGATSGEGPIGFVLLESAGVWVCLPLTLSLVAWAAQAWDRGQHRWALYLAPLGQRTLTLYVLHGLWCAVLFSGAGLGWTLNTVPLTALTLLAWVLALWAARRSTGRWPLEAWMGRRA